jgi:hypothetical protein
MEISGEWYDPDALSILENETRKERGMPKKRKNRDFVPE